MRLPAHRVHWHLVSVEALGQLTEPECSVIFGLPLAVVISCVRAGSTLLGSVYQDHLPSISLGLLELLAVPLMPPLDVRWALLRGFVLGVGFPAHEQHDGSPTSARTGIMA